MLLERVGLMLILDRIQLLMLVWRDAPLVRGLDLCPLVVIVQVLVLAMLIQEEQEGL